MKRIYYNGKVYTGELPFTEAFSVSDGRFLQVGSNEEILSAKEECDELIDLEGAFVCAGFNDSHMHLLGFGQALSFAPLAEHTDSLAAVIECLRTHLNTHEFGAGRWLCGRGWNQDFFTDTDRMPNRHDLDCVSKDIPIIITRTCGHCCVVNSKALELAGINADTPSPEGGAIGMENGEPDGRLFDNAIDLLNACRPLPDKAEIKDMIRLACKKLNSFGITSSQTDDYCVFRGVPYEIVNEAYRELESSGELTVRVYEQCNFTETSELVRFLDDGLVTGKGSDLFRIGPLKLLGDGALGSRTAYLSKPYLGTDNERGFPLFSREKMNELVSIANRNGMQVAVHAIGDACLDMVLDAIENALEECPRKDHRHGVVHCQISRKDQLERIAKLDLHVYAQSIFLDYDNHIVEKLVDPETARTSYCWRTLMKKGVSVSNGSDCPVELPDVMKGIQCAVTRRSLDGAGPLNIGEAFTVKEAIDSFTKEGAVSSFEENEKGFIRAGYLADFVIMESDPFESEAEELHEIKPKETYLSGRCVYKA
ncbi:MAG: amidohydrolase [Clostridiales bacterium]|nr:amidohydrolase [Clostridiales bacterium]